MKTIAWLQDMLIQHRTATQKAVKCELNGNQPKADEHYDREKGIRDEIIAYVEELEAKLAAYENHMDELAQQKGAE